MIHAHAGARLALAGVMLAAAATVSAQDDVERIRAALEKLPPTITLNIAQREPDFRVRIQERRPLQDIFDVPAWMPEKPAWPLPYVSFNLMSLVGYVAHELAEAKRAHDVRAARDEVQREIAAYCAAQPDGGAGVAICSSRR